MNAICFLLLIKLLHVVSNWCEDEAIKEARYIVFENKIIKVATYRMCYIEC